MACNQSEIGEFSLSLKSFVDTLTEEQKNDFRFSTLEDFKTAAAAIQNLQGSGKKMRNLARLRCFLEAMEQYGKVIEVFVNTSELVGFIWVYKIHVQLLFMHDANFYFRALQNFYFRHYSSFSLSHLY
jgi:hypothetical protein